MSSRVATTVALGGRMRSSTRGLRQDAARRVLAAATVTALTRIAERDLLESHAVVPGRAGDMQVPVDHCGSAKALVPVGRSHRPAPLCELRMAQDAGRLVE